MRPGSLKRCTFSRASARPTWIRRGNLKNCGGTSRSCGGCRESCHVRHDALRIEACEAEPSLELDASVAAQAKTIEPVIPQR